MYNEQLILGDRGNMWAGLSDQCVKFKKKYLIMNSSSKLRNLYNTIMKSRRLDLA